MSELTMRFPGLNDVEWPTLEDPAALNDAWRQAHYAAQAASELGKGWAAAREDDSHSALAWREGSLRSADSWDGLHASLSFEPFELRIGGERLSLEERTLDNATAWVRENAQRLMGPPLQASKPAPDLPEHELGTGSTFAVADYGAMRALRDLYGATDKALRQMSAALPDRPVVLCWPHHFDIAMLHVVQRDGAGAMQSTIGAGLAVPDDLEPAGYFYVSGWSREGSIATGDLPGEVRWEGSMGMLPVTVLSDRGGGALVGAFMSAAFGALHRALAG